MKSFYNPQYFQAVEQGRNARWIPKTIELPTLVSTYAPAPKTTSIELYPYQAAIFDDIADYTAGLLDAPTSFGKTIVSIALHQVWGGRTLIVCHSLQLVEQFAEEFKKFAPDVKVTKYTGKEKDTSGDAVITTHTTFRQKYNDFTNFNNLIIDEADLFSTGKSLRALNKFKASRKWGVTGTPKTKYDSCNETENGVLAEVYGRIVRGTEDEAKNPFKEAFYTEYKKVYMQDNTVIKPFQRIEYRGVLDDDIERKEAQMKWVLDNTESDGSTLILFDRVADAIWFNEHIKGSYLSHGEMPSKKREEDLQNFHDNGGYLCAVHTTVGRGYSNTKLTKVFVLFPLKSENTLIQIVGRIKRFYDGKKSSLYLWSDSTLAYQLKVQKDIIKNKYGLELWKY